MPLPDLAALMLFLFPLAYSPGPGNLFFAANGARFGFGQTLMANLGYHAATFTVTSLIGLGFAGVMVGAPNGFAGLRIIGSLYLFWLAYRLARAGASEGREAQTAGFLDGAILLVLNPKAYVIIALMFSQFLPSGPVDPARILLITSAFTANNCVAFSLYAVVGDRLAAGLRHSAKAQRLNLAFGSLLALTAVWMLVSPPG
ncbi:MAG: LysE family translocator [Albidovulum sp.]